MDKDRSLRFWKIRKENRMNTKIITDWVRRKEFKKLTKDKNCFGRITKGIRPELMNDMEYMTWIETLPKAKLRL